MDEGKPWMHHLKSDFEVVNLAHRLVHDLARYFMPVDSVTSPTHNPQVESCRLTIARSRVSSFNQSWDIMRTSLSIRLTCWPAGPLAVRTSCGCAHIM
jgi:hypothetical protein